MNSTMEDTAPAPPQVRKPEIAEQTAAAATEARDIRGGHRCGP